MAAPTALKASNEVETSIINDATAMDTEEDVLIDAAYSNNNDETQNNNEAQNDNERNETSNGVVLDESGKPRFPSVANSGMKIKLQTRKVPIPPHRMAPLRNAWMKIYPPLVEHLNLQVRMNTKKKTVELRTCKLTTDPGALQKGADFVKAFSLGFDVDDAISLLRLDDLYIETFEVKDVKMLEGDHLSRAIGRIAGKDGRTKFAIENTTRTRVVLADSKIHILGGYENTRLARRAVATLILGSRPGKVYGNLRNIAARMKESY